MGGVEEESLGGGGRFWGAPPNGAISHSAPLIVRALTPELMKVFLSFGCVVRK
jgi:hypothetical protein